MRPLPLLTFALFLSVAPSLRAENPPSATPNCATLYSSLDWEKAHNFSTAGMRTRRQMPAVWPFQVPRYWPASAMLTPLKGAKHWRSEVERLEKMKVAEVFPGLGTARRRGRDVAKADLSWETIKKYQETFDSLMTARVSAGILPKSELKSWRAWLRRQNADSPYPKIVLDDLNEEYAKHGHSLAEYFDDEFVRYVKDGKGIPVASVPEYLNVINPSAMGRAGEWIERHSRSLYLVAGVTFGGIVLEPVKKLVVGFTDPVMKPIEQAAHQGAKEVSEKIVGAVNEPLEKIGNALLLAPDNSKELLGELRETQAKLEAESYANGDRDETEKRFRERLAVFEKKLPEFRKLAQSLQKDFDAKYTASLEKMRSSMEITMANYDNQRFAFDMLTTIESRTQAGKVTAADRERIAYYQKEMDRLEDRVADALSHWLFYRATRGDKDPLETTLNSEYEKIYEKYMRAMNIEKLRARTSVLFDARVKMLDAWEKNTLKKDEKKAPLPGEAPLAPAAPQPPAEKSTGK